MNILEFLFGILSWGFTLIAGLAIVMLCTPVGWIGCFIIYIFLR